jgi:hypothetical protein
MMCAMRDEIDSPPAASPNGESPGVLANLPRTRPQRSSPRRAAARRATPKDPDLSAADVAVADGTAERATTRATSGPGVRRRTAPRGSDEDVGSRKPATTRSPGAKRARSTAARPAAEHDAGGGRVPHQGYECDDDAATGPVQPPGGSELLVSAVEIVGELAKAGLSRSERLLKDALSRLPLS